MARRQAVAGVSAAALALVDAETYALRLKGNKSVKLRCCTVQGRQKQVGPLGSASLWQPEVRGPHTAARPSFVVFLITFAPPEWA